MRWGDVVRVVIAGLIAAAFIWTGGARLPNADAAPAPLQHPPVIVYSEPMLAPLIVRAERIVAHKHTLSELARLGKVVHVSLTQYCLQGTTRLDHYVRPGIVAADPRLFPLTRYVEVFLGKHYLGRFLVDDTGKNVKGATLDIWTSSCSAARRFGRQWGSAMLVRR